MKEIKFCKKCGKELIKKKIDGFNEQTGEINFEMVCPIKNCRHTGHKHIWIDTNRKRSTGLVFVSIDKCINCGKEW